MRRIEPERHTDSINPQASLWTTTVACAGNHRGSTRYRAASRQAIVSRDLDHHCLAGWNTNIRAERDRGGATSSRRRLSFPIPKLPRASRRSGTNRCSSSGHRRKPSMQSRTAASPMFDRVNRNHHLRQRVRFADRSRETENKTSQLRAQLLAIRLTRTTDPATDTGSQS